MGGGSQEPTAFCAAALLERVANILARGDSEADSLQSVAGALARELAGRCTITLISRDPSGAARLLRYTDGPSANGASAEPLALADEHLTHRVLEHGTPLTAALAGGSHDPAAVDQALRTWVELAGCTGGIAVPVPGSEGPVGALVVGWVAEADALGEAAPRLLERVAALLAQHHAAATPMGVISLEGHFLRVNRALASVLGRPRDELMELGPLAVTYPPDRDRLVAMMGLMRAGSIRKAKFRQRWLAPGGAPVEALVSGAVIDGDDTAPRAFAFTVERRSSVAARQGEWDSLFTHSRQGIAVIGSDGRHVRVNEAYAEILGYAASELVGVPWRRPFPADCAPELEHAHAEMLSEGSACLETIGVRRDGSCFEAELELVVNDDFDGTPNGHLCLMRDIGERRRLELRRSELVRLSSLEHEGVDVDELIDDAVRTVREVLQGELASFFVLAGGEDELRLRAGVGWPRPQLGTPLGGPANSVLGRTLASAAPVVSSDLVSDPRFAGCPLLAETGVRGSATVLVGDADAPVGILGVHSRRPREFGPSEVLFLEAVSSLLHAATRRELAERRRTRARQDAVTGLPDATQFAESLERTLLRAVPAPLAVLVVGVELPRDLPGRPGRNRAADMLLECASRIASQLGSGGFLGRLGDRSFGIVLPGADELKAAAVARCVLRAVAQPFVFDGIEHTVHSTVGVAVTTNADDPSELIDEADTARRRGKELGSDRLEFFEAEETGPDSPLHRLGDDLADALRREELRVRYQPVFDLSDRTICGIEALLYWEHPSRTVLPPELFLPIARRTGVIVPIGRWVLEQSIRHFVRWREGVRADGRLHLFVNLSTRELASPSLLDTVAGTLQAAGVAPEQLALDIPEAALMHVDGAASRSIAALRELGASIVLDRFGTALSSPAQLGRRPIDTVKLDRSCVAGIADAGPERDVVRAVLGVAPASGMQVIACGVETERQAEALADLGCSHAQGALFAEPMAAPAVSKLLRWTGDRARRQAS